MKFVVGKKYYFVMNPMKYFEDSSYLVMFRSFNDCSGDWSESVLDCLQAFRLRRVDVVEKLITVIDLGMNN